MEAAIPNSLPVAADPSAQRRRWRLLALGVMLLGVALLAAASRFEFPRAAFSTLAMVVTYGGYAAWIVLDQTVRRPGAFSLVLALLGLLPGGIGLILHLLATRRFGEAVLTWLAVMVMTGVSFWIGAVLAMVVEGVLLLG